MKKMTHIIFIDDEGGQSKTKKISTFLLRQWKIALMVFGLLFLSSFLAFAATFWRKNEIKNELLSIKNNPEYIKSKKISEDFDKINNELHQLKSYLEKKGIKAKIQPNVGGPTSHQDEFTISEKIKVFQSEITKLNTSVKNFPIGLPHKGKITSEYGARANPFSNEGIEGHQGIDIKGDIGDPVKSPANAKVQFAGVLGGYGNCIILDHADDYVTVYGHLSKLNVVKGQVINANQIIGLIGSTGRSTGPHLHYEIRKKDQKINPLQFVQ